MRHRLVKNYKAEAEGVQKVLEAKASGYQSLVASAGGDAKAKADKNKESEEKPEPKPKAKGRRKKQKQSWESIVE